MTDTETNVSGSPLIDKHLFEAGLQCAKRLYLEYHHASERPAPGPHRQDLAEIGEHLVELASQAFPKGVDLGGDDLATAAVRTAEFLETKTPGVLFHAAFQSGGAQVRIDILLVPAPGQIDIFEVKAGTTVKPRHLHDVALQIHAIESAGHKVSGATILHLDPNYTHDGSRERPVHKLFRSVDVMPRARRQLDRIRERIRAFRAILEDEGTLELPTGTWCRNPLPCEHLPRCVAEGPDHPLVQLPQLTPNQESRLHEEAIESIDQIDPERTNLTVLQRRVVRAVQSDELVVEPFVSDELQDLDWPAVFVHVGWHLDVLPRFAGTHPWSKMPFAWGAFRLEQDGRLTPHEFVSTSPDDPREPALEQLAKVAQDAGTLIVFDRTFDERLRAMLEEDPPAKKSLRTLLQLPLLELGGLIQHGVYSPGFGGEFSLWTVHDAITAARAESAAAAIPDFDGDRGGEIPDDEHAAAAYRRLLNRRTRAQTRERLGTELSAWARRSAGALVRIHRALGAKVD